MAETTTEQSAEASRNSQAGTAERLIQRLEYATPGSLFCCDADREEAVEIAAEEIAAALAAVPPAPLSRATGAGVEELIAVRPSFRQVGSTVTLAYRSQDDASAAYALLDAAADARLAAPASLAQPEAGELREAFRNADAEDWRRLDEMIGHSGHGKFWRAVFNEARAALARTTPPQDAGGEAEASHADFTPTVRSHLMKREEMAWIILGALRTDIPLKTARELYERDWREGYRRAGWVGAFETALRQADAILAPRPPVEQADPAGWLPIETAPKDGTSILVYAPGASYDLPDIVCSCCWHEDAGFCVDELREPTMWMPLPAAPSDAEARREGEEA